MEEEFLVGMCDLCFIYLQMRHFLPKFGKKSITPKDVILELKTKLLYE